MKYSGEKLMTWWPAHFLDSFVIVCIVIVVKNFVIKKIEPAHLAGWKVLTWQLVLLMYI